MKQNSMINETIRKLEIRASIVWAGALLWPVATFIAIWTCSEANSYLTDSSLTLTDEERKNS